MDGVMGIWGEIGKGGGGQLLGLHRRGAEQLLDGLECRDPEHGGRLRFTWWTQSRNCRKMGVKPLPWLPGLRLLRWLNLWPNESHSFSSSTWKPSRVL